MKKLRLNLSNVNELLSREQMKKFSGGYPPPFIPPPPPDCMGNSCSENDSSNCGSECSCQSFEPGRWSCL